MSSLLKEAFIEAQKLKEAARQQAETDLVDKYATEIKENMNRILENQVQTEGFLDEAPEPEPDLGFAGPDDDFEMGAEPDMFDFEDDLEFPDNADNSYLDDQVPLSFGDDEDLCACPDDEEEIEIDFDDLMGMSTDDDVMTGPETHEDAADDIMGMDDEESFLQEFELDESLFEEYLNEESVPYWDETPEERSARIMGKVSQAEKRQGEFAPRKGPKSDDHYARKAKMQKFGDQWDDINQRHKQDTEATAVGSYDFDDDDDEATGAAIPSKLEEEFEVDLSEELTADVEEQPSGWSPRPDSEFDDEFDKLFAKLKNPGGTKDQDKVKKSHSEPNDRRTQKDTHDYVKEAKKIEQYRRISKKYIKENRNLEQKVTNYKQKLLEVADLMQQLNLENVKLQLQKKVFGNNSLNERQKQRIVEAISDAKTVGEAQRVFKLQESAAGSQAQRKQSGQNPLAEALRNKPSASSVLQSSRRGRIEEEKAIVSEDVAGRWKKIAGILND